jgi:DNA (cytosine-5)-methyltransferase 1
MMKVLDLFSGIGGFSLGLERTGGFETVAFCEIEPYCQAVLRKHWPEVPVYDDIRELTIGRLVADGIEPDVICGGFPCQDVSGAGSREGIEGQRSGLWSEFARLIGELRPRFAIVENVAALLERGISRVLGDLAALGYDAEWHCVSATAVGLPHVRDRVWIVSYPATLRRDEGLRRSKEWRRLLWPWSFRGSNSWSEAANNDKVRSSFIRVVDGLPNHVDRLGGLGNAVVPQIPELIGRAILSAHKCEVN